MPSYPTVRRYMKDQGLLRQRRRRPRNGDTAAASGSESSTPREKRSYEVSHVHQLWHLDFHAARARCSPQRGSGRTPMLLGILDDHSRLCCHLQWYLGETAECLIHGLCQALAKRGRPRALMTDNGSAMVAAGDPSRGLRAWASCMRRRCPIPRSRTRKQECFWGQVEGRLMADARGRARADPEPCSTTATQAWVEQEYQRSKHAELGESPFRAPCQALAWRAPAPRRRRCARLSPADHAHAATLRRHLHGPRGPLRGPHPLSHPCIA